MASIDSAVNDIIKETMITNSVKEGYAFRVIEVIQPISTIQVCATPCQVHHLVASERYLYLAVFHTNSENSQTLVDGIN